MKKLPLEIRQQIYKQVLGGITIKLAIYSGKLDARRYHACDYRYKRDACRLDGRLNLGLGVLRTCRQM